MKRTILIVAGLLIAAAPPLSAADVEANWKKQCTKCHGADGKGDTKMGKKSGAKDYTDPKVQAEMKDEDMIKAIVEGIKEDGKTKMKAYDKLLTEEEIKAFIPKIRAFAK